MKWTNEYDVDIKELQRLNHDEGWSLPELAIKFKVPRTTLNRYFVKAGIPVYFNSHKGLETRRLIRRKKEDFRCNSAWKRALVERFGHKCMVCDYGVIVEAHHVTPRCDGGKSSIDNGVLLCPNHHAEAHAGLFDLIALSKSGELLEKQTSLLSETVNQQPSRKSSKKWLRKHIARVAEGSETSDEAKAIMSPRAPDSLTAEDIVQPANI
jgi:hypothetical protein